MTGGKISDGVMGKILRCYEGFFKKNGVRSNFPHGVIAKSVITPNYDPEKRN
jgi:hypothetical protein